MLQLDSSRCTGCGLCQTVCPFDAIDMLQDRPVIGAACKACGICVKKCPEQALALPVGTPAKQDLSIWQHILVYIELEETGVHPVSLEMAGKAQALAAQCGAQVYGVVIGTQAGTLATALLPYGFSRIYWYEDPLLAVFTQERYVEAMIDCIDACRPATVLVGATPQGRTLAPGVATHFRTGVTADCTSLEVTAEGNLVQIRPAFGGNIMARIVTPHTRPQFATVRYKVMTPAQRQPAAHGEIIPRTYRPQRDAAHYSRVLEVSRTVASNSISDAKVLIAAGRGLKSAKDLAMIERIADALGGQWAVTRPLVEAGWAPYTRQLGLSGRSAAPELLVTCGVSGAVQFTAAVEAAQHIIAIDANPEAPIFRVAHIGITGDLYQILPALEARIAEAKGGRMR